MVWDLIHIKFALKLPLWSNWVHKDDFLLSLSGSTKILSEVL